MNEYLTTIQSEQSKGTESAFKKILESFFPTVQRRKSESLTPQEISLGSFNEPVVRKIFKNWLSFWMNPDMLHLGIFDSLAAVLHSEETLLKENAIIQEVLKEHTAFASEDELLLAVQKCTKIFHEDFPGNYILAYKGKKLGMFVLKCIPESSDSYALTYFYHADLTDFNYL